MIKAHCTPHEMSGLASSEWMRAWEAVENSYAPFLEDVDAVWKASQQVNHDESAAGHRTLSCLGLEVRCAIARSRARDLAGVFSGDLLTAQVASGEWSIDEAMVRARHMPTASMRAEAMIKLARVARRVCVSREKDILQEATRAAREIVRWAERSAVLAKVATAMTDMALMVVRAIGCSSFCGAGQIVVCVG